MVSLESTCEVPILCRPWSPEMGLHPARFFIRSPASAYTFVIRGTSIDTVFNSIGLEVPVISCAGLVVVAAVVDIAGHLEFLVVVCPVCRPVICRACQGW